VNGAVGGPSGALIVGGPAELTENILAHHRVFGFTGIAVQMAIVQLGHKSLMNLINIQGTRVAPDVRKALGHEPSKPERLKCLN